MSSASSCLISCFSCSARPTTGPCYSACITPLPLIYFCSPVATEVTAKPLVISQGFATAQLHSRIQHLWFVTTQPAHRGQWHLAVSSPCDTSFPARLAFQVRETQPGRFLFAQDSLQAGKDVIFIPLPSSQCFLESAELKTRATTFIPVICSGTDAQGTGSPGEDFLSCLAYRELLYHIFSFLPGRSNQLWHQICAIRLFHTAGFWGRAKYTHTPSPARPLIGDLVLSTWHCHPWGCVTGAAATGGRV